MKSKIKLMLVDDQQLFRDGMFRILNDFQNIEVIAEAKNGLEAINQLELVSPEVILLDIDMPIMNGIEASKQIKKKFPGIKIIILTMYDETLFVLELLKYKVDGFLPKNANIEEVIEAINIVFSGGIYLSDDMTARLEVSNDIKKSIHVLLEQKSLNEVEIEVLKLICNGKSGKEISDSLKISLDTLNYHKKNLKNKTKCNSVADFVIYAIRHGIININPLN